MDMLGRLINCRFIIIIIIYYDNVTKSHPQNIRNVPHTVKVATCYKSCIVHTLQYPIERQTVQNIYSQLVLQNMHDFVSIFLF